MPTNPEYVQLALWSQAIGSSLGSFLGLGGFYGLFPLFAGKKFSKVTGASSDDELFATALQSTSVGAFLATFAAKGGAYDKKLALFVGSATCAAMAISHSTGALGKVFNKIQQPATLVCTLAAVIGAFVAAKKTTLF